MVTIPLGLPVRCSPYKQVVFRAGSTVGSTVYCTVLAGRLDRKALCCSTYNYNYVLKLMKK